MKEKFYAMVVEQYTEKECQELFERWNNRKPNDMNEFWRWLKGICFRG